MTQFNHTLAALLSGKKTETSRIIKPGDYHGLSQGLMIAHWLPSQQGEWYASVHFGNWKTHFEVGKEYAIQPHRTAKSIGKFKIDRIWRQDVRTLTPEQVKAEGFNSLSDFLIIWCKMHDKSQNPVVLDVNDKPLGDERHKAFMMQHPHPERYQAWRMTIRVLWGTVNWEAPAVRALQIVKPTL